MNKPAVTQKHLKCAKELVHEYLPYGPAGIARLLARHFPDVPAADKPSIWRPVGPGTMPTDKDGSIVAYNTYGNILYYHYNAGFGGMTHWCRISDLLAACPLPRGKAPEELDGEAWEKLLSSDAYTGENRRKELFLAGCRSARERMNAGKDGAK
jgi:hypothetical protein